MGIKTYSFDALTDQRVNSNNPNAHRLGVGIPDGVKMVMRKHAGVIMYLKSLQTMFALAQWRIQRGENKPVMFIFDEVQAMQKKVSAMISEIYQEMNANKPKGKNDEPSDKYLYYKAVADFVKDLETQFTTYTITTGRASGVYSIFIGQSPNAQVWNDMKIGKNGDYPAMEMFGKVTRAGTVRKLIGRGASSSKYGLSELDPKLIKYVNQHRFFGMYNGNVCEGATIDVFKPFLTLNNDNILDKCWTRWNR